MNNQLSHCKNWIGLSYGHWSLLKNSTKFIEVVPKHQNSRLLMKFLVGFQEILKHSLSASKKFSVFQLTFKFLTFYQGIVLVMYKYTIIIIIIHL